MWLKDKNMQHKFLENFLKIQISKNTFMQKKMILNIRIYYQIICSTLVIILQKYWI